MYMSPLNLLRGLLHYVPIYLRGSTIGSFTPVHADCALRVYLIYRMDYGMDRWNGLMEWNIS